MSVFLYVSVCCHPIYSGRRSAPFRIDKLARASGGLGLITQEKGRSTLQEEEGPQELYQMQKEGCIKRVPGFAHAVTCCSVVRRGGNSQRLKLLSRERQKPSSVYIKAATESGHINIREKICSVERNEIPGTI